MMRPLADAIRAERRLAEHERRPRRPILLGKIGRKRLRHSGLEAR
jgi:hypothetical protein